MRKISIEMMNLMCMFDHSGRDTLIKDIVASLPYIDDTDMADLMEQTMRFLENMTDEEFAEIEFNMIWVRDGALRHCPVPSFLFVRKMLQIILVKAIDIIPNLEYNIYRTFLTRYNRMKYISAKEAAKKWGLTPRRVGVLCNEGRIEGAYKAGASWIIPDDAEKPNDARIKSGKYIKKDRKD